MAKLRSILLNRYFLTVWISIAVVFYWFFDQSIAYYFQQVHGSSFYDINNRVTQYGKGTLYIATFAVILLISYFILKKPILTRYSLFLLASSTIPGIICNAIKVVISRARPSQLYEHEFYGFYFFQLKSTFWSMPSGHATAIMGTMVALSLLFPKGRFLFIGFGIIVSLTRISVTAHYVSDVMLGMLLGSLLAYWLHHEFVRRFNMPPEFSLKQAWKGNQS